MNVQLLDDEDQPTGYFTALVDDMVRSTIKARHAVPQSGDFFCPAICNSEGNVSYWGVIDFAAIPEEDLYVEIRRRFSSATQQLGQFNIAGFGLVSLPAVMNRVPLAGKKMPPQQS